MEHDEAIRLEAAERYVARELSAEEQHAFEAHFFDCPRCAEDVRFELTFAANTRAVSREQRIQGQPAAPRLGLLGTWQRLLQQRPALAFSFAANIVLAVGFGYILLNGGRASLRPQFIPAHLALGPTHGSADDVHMIPAGNTFYFVRFIPPDPAGARYSYQILDTAGRPQSSGSLQAPRTEDDFLYLQVPVQSLRSGVYTLVVRAGLTGEIVSWSKFTNSR